MKLLDKQYKAITNFIQSGLDRCISDGEEPVLIQIPSYLLAIMRRHTQDMFFNGIQVTDTYLKMCVVLIYCKSGKALSMPTA